MVTKKKLTKEEWEAMTGTDMSLILPSDGSIETARESSLNDTGKPFFRFRESKTANPCLSAARYVTGWTSLSAGWEDVK